MCTTFATRVIGTKGEREGDGRQEPMHGCWTDWRVPQCRLEIFTLRLYPPFRIQYSGQFDEHQLSDNQSNQSLTCHHAARSQMTATFPVIILSPPPAETQVLRPALGLLWETDDNDNSKYPIYCCTKYIRSNHNYSKGSDIIHYTDSRTDLSRTFVHDRVSRHSFARWPPRGPTFSGV
jgi:hypothetical protein